MILFWMSLAPMITALIGLTWLVFRAFRAIKRHAGNRAPDRVWAATPAGSDDGDPTLLAISWREAEWMSGSRDAVAGARERCERLLRASATAPLDLGLLEWTAFVRTRVPQLVAAFKHALVVSGGEIAPATGDELTAILREIGEEAERRLDAHRQDRDAAFASLCSFARQRIGGTVGEFVLRAIDPQTLPSRETGP